MVGRRFYSQMVKAQIPLDTSRHNTTRHVVFCRSGLISHDARRQLFSFSYVNFRFDLDYLHFEPRRQRFSALREAT